MWMDGARGIKMAYVTHIQRMCTNVHITYEYNTQSNSINRELFLFRLENR